MRKVWHPFRERERRKAARLGHMNYVVIKNTLTGQRRVEEGPKLEFLDAYEVHTGIFNKYVLKKDQYIRFVDKLTGQERVVRGAQSVMPGPWENSTEGVQQALSINMETAVVVWNRMTGKKSLYQESGMYFP